MEVESIQKIAGEIHYPYVLAAYTVEEKLQGARYMIHNDKIVMVGYNLESFYFYVNGKKVASRSPGKTPNGGPTSGLCEFHVVIIISLSNIGTNAMNQTCFIQLLFFMITKEMLFG